MAHDAAHPEDGNGAGYDWADPHHFRHGGDAQADHDHDGHHVTPWQLLVGILFVLLSLTFLTVASAQFETWLIALGVHISHFWNVIIAMVIALAKATLVCMFFMHLKHDNPLNTMILLTTLFVFMLFFLFTGIDLYERDAINEFKSGYIESGGTGIGVTLTGGNFGDTITNAVKQRHIDAIALELAAERGHLDDKAEPAPTEDDQTEAVALFWADFYHHKLEDHPEHLPDQHSYDTSDIHAEWIAQHVAEHGHHHFSTANETVARHGHTPGLFGTHDPHAAPHGDDQGNDQGDHQGDAHGNDHAGENPDDHPLDDHAEEKDH